MNEESEYLFNNMKTFSLEQSAKIEWDRLEKEISYLEDSLSFEHIMEFYQTNLLASDVHPTIFRIFSQKFKSEAQYLDLETQATQIASEVSS